MKRDGPLDHVTRIQYRTVDGTAQESDRDYVTIIEDTLTLGVDQAEATIEVKVLDDGQPEPDEVFYIELYGAEGGMY